MKNIDCREFLKLSAAGGALCFAGPGVLAGGMIAKGQASEKIISPGCRGSKVRIVKIYMGHPAPHWPKPSLNLDKEIEFYESQFTKFKGINLVNEAV